MANVDALNQEMNQAANNAKDTGTQIQSDVTNFPDEVQYRIKVNLNKAKTALTEVKGSVDAGCISFLFNSYSWAGQGLNGVFMGELIGKSVVAGILRNLTDTWASIIAVTILEPLTVWAGYKVMKQNERKEVLLGFSVLLGAVIGAALQGRQMDFFVLPAATLPLVMALAAYATGFVANSVPALLSDRKIFLPFLILPALATFYMFAPAEKGGMTYFLYAAVLMVIGFIDVQVKIDEYNGGLGSVTVAQWTTVVVLGIADQIAFWLFSSAHQ